MFCQFCPEHWSLLISDLNSFQDVLKVSDCSGLWLNPCRGRWRLALISKHTASVWGGLPVLAAMPSPASTTSPAGRVLTWPGLGQSARGEASLKAGDAEKQCEWWLCAGDGGTVTCLQRRLGPKSWNPVLRFLTAELHSVTEPGFPAAENPRSLVCCPSQRAGGLPVATY